MKKAKVIVILGQTATGKSALAVKIAKKIHGEVISADSRQVYKGLDIGTGKITKKETRGISHHLLDVANPKRQFSVAQYQTLVISAIADIVRRKKIPIICGGTGFYIDAITNGTIFPEVPPNKKLRAKLYSKSAIANFEYLLKLDPERAQNIDPKNKVRLIRAIEIASVLGRVPEITEKAMPYRFFKIGLYLPKEKLLKKVENRVKKMFKDGLLTEIRRLKKAGLSQKRLRELGFEYNDPTYEKVVNGTMKYAKRQMVWFKRDKEIKWLDASRKININSLLNMASL